MLAQRRGRAIDARLGKAKDPYAKSEEKAFSFVIEVLTSYEQAGYPDRFLRVRENLKTREGEQRAVAMLRTFFKVQRVEDLDQAICDAYHKWRCKGAGKIGKGSGNRTVELELNVLSNALTWAARTKKIESNPIAKRARYRRAEEIRHCVEFKPDDAEELPQIVRFLFAKKKSQVLGFQALVEAYTGLRTEETLMLRTDAGPRQPGWISPDGKHLFVWRLKNQHKNNPYVAVRPGLRASLDALFRWKRDNYPESAWFFPSPYDPAKTVDKSSLGHRLADYCSSLAHEKAEKEKPKAGKGKDGNSRHEPESESRSDNDQANNRNSGTPPCEARKLTSHGLRAWYVTVRRSHDVSDAQIAYEIGHTSGGRTLAEVYGGIPSNWLEDGGPKMSWLPKEPAWTTLGYDEMKIVPEVTQVDPNGADEED